MVGVEGPDRVAGDLSAYGDRTALVGGEGVAAGSRSCLLQGKEILRERCHGGCGETHK
jgi:hypothetical protein